MPKTSDLDTVTPAESQAWVKLALEPWESIDYIPDYDYDESLVGEDDRGYILARRDGTVDYWELFDVTNSRHRAAAEESKRRRLVNFLELEPTDEEP